jgi:hypothetical protein
VGDEQLAADAIERVALAATVAERLLLHPPADLVEGRVGQTHGVEVVHNQLGMAQPVGQAPGGARVGVQGDRPDGRPPWRRAGRQPPRNPLRRAALDHIQEAMAVQVDESGDQQRRVLGAGGEERVFIDAQGPGGTEPGQMIHPRAPVIAHRRHGGVPADPEDACHLRDRTPSLAN